MNKKPTNLATWQLPAGVSSGTWDYAQTDSIATDYDRYFQSHGMFRLDQEIASRYMVPGKWVIDLGCGTGRATIPLADRGLNCVAFDLSQSMLDAVNAKPVNTPNVEGTHPRRITCVRGNLVDLSCFEDRSFDYAMCLFSTLGMIRGSQSRNQFVEHVARVLSTEGVFILQVHNYWAHLFDPKGPLWMLRNLVRTRLHRDVEIGDNFFLYRGVPNMYLHSFSKREVIGMLQKNGFEVLEWLPLNARQNGWLRFPSIADGIRASGWIVVAQKSSI